MKKIKDFLIPNQTSKYSEKFYNSILLRSSVIVLLLSSILLIFFTGQIVNNRMNEAKKQLHSENEVCYSTLEDVLTNTKNISMFFARFKDISPLYQAESQVDSRLVMLRQEAESFVACFDYLDGINVETPDFSVSFSMSDYVEYNDVQVLKPFTLYATTPESYPHLLKLSYVTSNLDTFSVDIAIYSDYLCTHYMSENSYLLSTDGTILLAHDYTLIGKSINDVFGVDCDTIRSGKTDSTYLHTASYFAEDGICLVSLSSKAEVYKGTVGQILSILFIYIVIMVIAIMFLSMILGLIYRPIKNVVQVLKYHMPDNDSMMESDAIFIQNCMKRYSTSADLDAALLQIRKSQLQTLHAQISPHLLGNSLEAIKWRLIPVVGNDSKLVRSITSLSMFLTEVYEYQRMITSIGAEIERTKSYADMMVYCFYPTLQIKWDVNDELLDCAIVNLTLQPFIENCIEHGFSRMEEEPHISIRVSTNEETIFVEIEDNGTGMDSETLAEIRKALDNDSSVAHHIGIKNSHLKLKLLFGDDYGVTDIESDDKGTYVKLVLPKIKAPMV